MKTRIHVNQHKIKANHKNETKDPVIGVICRNKTQYTNIVKINGPSAVIYSPDKPLKCGARCFIETDSEVEFIA